MLSSRPDVLRADLQRFYTLDLDGLGTVLRIRRVADLAANLPEEARIWAVLDAKAAWNTTQYLLAKIADSAAFIAWTRSKQAERNGVWNGWLPRPGEQTSTEDKTGGLPINELMGALYG